MSKRGTKNEAKTAPCRRPPGWTNDEFHELKHKVDQLARGLSTSLGARYVIVAERLRVDLLTLLEEFYVLPDKERSYVDDEYIRQRYGIRAPGLDAAPSPADLVRHKTRCEICQENRSVDRAHVVPASIGGLLVDSNYLVLCPTHHRLFDRGRLSRPEWNTITWKDRPEWVSDFAQTVLLRRQEDFWHGQDVVADIEFYNAYREVRQAWLARHAKHLHPRTAMRGRRRRAR